MIGTQEQTQGEDLPKALLCELETITFYIPVFLTAQFSSLHFINLSMKMLSETVLKIILPKSRVVNLLFFLPPQYPELHHPMVTAAKAPPDFHISDQLLLV